MPLECVAGLSFQVDNFGLRPQMPASYLTLFFFPARSGLFAVSRTIDIGSMAVVAQYASGTSRIRLRITSTFPKLHMSTVVTSWSMYKTVHFSREFCLTWGSELQNIRLFHGTNPGLSDERIS